MNALFEPYGGRTMRIKPLIIQPPLDLSDEAAWAFRCLLYDFAREFENYYNSQIQRYLFPQHNQSDLSLGDIDEHDEHPPF